MSDLAQKARSRFLDRAAHSYAVSAPSTSAHLMMEYRTVAAGSGSDGPLLQPKGTCGACGNIMIPGQTCRTRLTDRRVSRQGLSHRKKKRHNPSKPRRFKREKTFDSECVLCRRTSRKPLQSSQIPKPAEAEPLMPLTERSRTASSIPDKASMPRIVHSDLPQPSQTNASSKKRAKARKESGLGAMLAKAQSRHTPARGFGLDLLDMTKEV